MGIFKIPETPPTVNKTIRFPSDVVQKVETVIRARNVRFPAL